MFYIFLNLLFVSLSIGLYFNAIFEFFGFYLFDLNIFLIFVYSLFKIKYKNRKFNLIFGLFIAYLLILLLLNTKLLFGLNSILYLVRLAVYVYSYPFFIFLISNFIKYKKTVNFYLVLSLITNLLVFFIYPNLNVKGFDPHINRLYGQLLDPNYYGVLCVFIIHYALNSFKNNRKLSIFLIFLCTLSIYLTFSRLAFIGFILVLLLNYKKIKYPEFGYMAFFVSILFFLNFNFLSRFLFIEGNFDSFFYRILNFVDALIIYNSSLLPFGFNNIASHTYFLTSNINNASSYFDFFAFNLLLSGGLIFVLVFSLFVTYASKSLKTEYKIPLFLLIALSFGMNIFFSPYFLLIFVLIVAKVLNTNKS